MMKIKSLQNTSFDKIFEAFSNAFNTYEVQLNHNELKTMLQRRGFDPELSFAAFDDDTIVSFTLNGIGDYNGRLTAYDTGTGTIKAYRGQNLASTIFEYSIPYLKAKQINHYLLEVLQHNTSAVNIYKKIGFEVNREFNYFVQNNDKILIKSGISDSRYSIQPTTLNQCKTSTIFCDFIPSWQNSFDAINRNAENFTYLGAFFNNQCIGYCIMEPIAGDITQIAVNKAHRREGVGSSLLTEAMKLNLHDSIKIINTEINCTSITQFLASCNITPGGKQFEMIKKI